MHRMWCRLFTVPDQKILALSSVFSDSQEGLKEDGQIISKGKGVISHGKVD